MLISVLSKNLTNICKYLVYILIAFRSAADRELVHVQ